MRLSDAGPRTWLLATVAGWALLAWVLALVGMGGRIGTLPDDPSLSRALPDVPKLQPERIGPIAQYAETAQRPLFSEDRRPQPFSLQPQGDENAAQQFEFVLTSVLITPKLQMAIITPTNGGQPIRMKQDEAPAEAQGWRLVSLEPRAATFIGPQGEKRMELRTFDGKGGTAPTTTAAPDITMDAPADATSVAAPPPVPPPAAANATAPQQTGSTLEEAPMTPEQQMDAIRKRIEQRRAQLRQEAQQQNNQKTPAQ
ncbi:hypothetical protein AB4059_10515 [Lysobacter sp. 2RAF19]